MTMLKADVKKWIEATQAFEKKDYSTCISILQSANESSKICFTLGMAYYNLNQPKDAYYYFGRSVEFDTFLAVGYFMRGVCALLIGDSDSAYWDFAGALEKLREHEYIDYTQLKMPYRLLRSEILFNLALSLISGGRDAYDVINQARSCQEIHDEQKTDFHAGLQKLGSGQSSGIKPLSIDKSKVFQPPKVNTGGPSDSAPKGSKPPSMKQEEPKARDDPSRNPPSRSQPAPVRGSRPAPSPGGGGSQSYPSSNPVPSRSLPSVPTGGRNSPSASSIPQIPTPSPSRAPVKRPANPLPPAPGRSNGGPAPRGKPQGPLPTPPVEMVRVKVYYKDKRLVEIPKDNPIYADVKSRVESKFAANGLLLKYQMTSGEIKTIKNQNDLNDAVAQGLTDMYVNKPGEVNEFEPKPPNAADEGWQECYTDDGQLYYFNMQSGESSWDPPANWGGASSVYSPPAPKLPKPKKQSDWIECYTDTGDKYWYNTKTDESSWDPPANF